MYLLVNNKYCNEDGLKVAMQANPCHNKLEMWKIKDMV